MPRLAKKENAPSRVAPVVIRKALETAEQKVGQDRPRAMKSTGPAKDSLEPSIIETVDRPVSKEKLELLRFMDDELTIRVADSTNPMDEPNPEVINGGIRQYFVRGIEQKVKRKFVEVLARAKKTAFSQELYQDGAGNSAYRQVPHTALRFDFAVLHDPSPRGRDWLKAILAEG